MTSVHLPTDKISSVRWAGVAQTRERVKVPFSQLHTYHDYRGRRDTFSHDFYIQSALSFTFGNSGNSKPRKACAACSYHHQQYNTNKPRVGSDDDSDDGGSPIIKNTGNGTRDEEEEQAWEGVNSLYKATKITYLYPIERRQPTSTFSRVYSLISKITKLQYCIFRSASKLYLTVKYKLEQGAVAWETVGGGERGPWHVCVCSARTTIRTAREDKGFNAGCSKRLLLVDRHGKEQFYVRSSILGLDDDTQ